MKKLNKWRWVSDSIGFEDLTEWMNTKNITPEYCVWIENNGSFLVVWKEYYES